MKLLSLSAQKTITSTARGGFTLAELMFATAIFGLLGLGIAAFTRDSSLIIFKSTEKLEINRDVRHFTTRLSVDAQEANEFRIYPSFALSDRNSAQDALGPGNSGDFMLLIYQKPHPNTSDPEHITRLVGYFRDFNADNEGPVYRFEISYSSNNYKNAATFKPEDLIVNVDPVQDTVQVVELSRGLAGDALFYNYFGRSVMIKAEILHGNNYTEVSDTYNYTVSPRG